MGFTRKAVILKESRGQHPNTTHTLINFKTMTTFNTDFNTTELLDQELTIEQLEAVAGGISPVIVAGLILKPLLPRIVKAVVEANQAR